HSWP
ncbi:unnamed protein product, partial [Allacma fusca]